MRQLEGNDIEALLSIKSSVLMTWRQGKGADRHLVIKVLGEGSTLHHQLLVQQGETTLEDEVRESA